MISIFMQREADFVCLLRVKTKVFTLVPLRAHFRPVMYSLAVGVSPTVRELSCHPFACVMPASSLFSFDRFDPVRSMDRPFTPDSFWVEIVKSPSKARGLKRM